MGKLYVADKTTLDKVLSKVDIILANLMVINNDETLKTKVVQNYFNTKKNGKTFGVFFNDFTISTVSTGTRKYDAEGMIARASTDSSVARNDFDEYAIFNGLTVNGYVGTDGEFVVTYLEGEEGFSKTEHDTYILFGTSYVKIDIDAYGETISVSDTERDGYFPMGGAVRTDGTIRSFIPIAKYMASKDSDGNPASVSGQIALYNNASYNWNVTNFHTKGTQYCSTTMNDRFLIETLFQVVFATRNSQSIMTGCTSYSSQTVCAKAETGVKRILLTKGQGSNYIVGSRVSIGTLSSSSASKDRGNSYMHSCANRVLCTNIETVTVDGTEYDAVYVDVDTSFDTTTLTYISAMPWHTGACDDVLGTCGSIVNNTNGKYPYIFFGVEMFNGQYEVMGNAIFINTAGSDGNMVGSVYICYDCANLATSANTSTANYVKVEYDIPSGTNAWKYVSKLGFDSNNPCARMASELAATSSNGYADGNYMNNLAGTFEVLLGGNLDNGSNAGLFNRNLNNGLGNANWNISARISVYKASLWCHFVYVSLLVTNKEK